MEKATLEEIKKHRKEFIALVEDVFGSVHSGGVKFGRYNSLEIADYLDIHISRGMATKRRK